MATPTNTTRSSTSSGWKAERFHARSRGNRLGDWRSPMPTRTPTPTPIARSTRPIGQWRRSRRKLELEAGTQTRSGSYRLPQAPRFGVVVNPDYDTSPHSTPGRNGAVRMHPKPLPKMRVFLDPDDDERKCHQVEGTSEENGGANFAVKPGRVRSRSFPTQR